MPLLYEIVTVHTEGDTGDVLFTLPPPARPMREGDVIRYVNTADVSVTYLIESIDYVIHESAVNPNPNNITLEGSQPEIFYGVSVVP